MSEPIYYLYTVEVNVDGKYVTLCGTNMDRIMLDAAILISKMTVQMGPATLVTTHLRNAQRL